MDQVHTTSSPGTFRRLVSAAKTLIRDKSGDPRDVSLWTRARNSLRRLDSRGASEMPQADLLEENLERFEERDWRTHFAAQLQGRGLEIGPLHRPMVQHPGMQIEYIDRCTVAELRAHYPELRDLPLVEPHIIGDASDLSGIPDTCYDFVIAAHVIEHMTNPIRALSHWCRVLKPGGKIYLIAPDKRAIFDHKRVRTTLEHLILDFKSPSKERDREHYLEYALHVHGKNGEEALEEAERLIRIDYSIHYHTFIPSDLLRLVEWFSGNVRPLRVLEGPSMAPRSDEFHLMVEV